MKPDPLNHFGMITSIAWNSNKWQDQPTKHDLDTIQYKNPKETRLTADYLSFAHQKMGKPGEYFVTFSSILKDQLPQNEKVKEINVLFLISTNHGGDGLRYVVGIYAFPEFSHDYKMHPDNTFKEGNIRSKTEHIVLLNNYLALNPLLDSAQILPEGKHLSSRGWNYLHKKNVTKIFRYILAQNPQQASLFELANMLGLDVPKQAEEELLTKDQKESVDDLSEIIKLEKEMMNASLKKKQRLSVYIERGTIAHKIKALTGYKCLICEKMGLNPLSFTKPNGIPYIETHHVIPVSQQQKGSLSITNLLTVCANHHRQFHYGNVNILENNNSFFTFDFDGKKIQIEKLKLEQ